MRIRTQFFLTMILFGLVILAVSISALITNNFIELASTQEQTAGNIARGASELSYLANDYVIYRESQQLDRWLARYNSFSTDVASLQTETPEQVALVNNIRANSLRLREVFDSVKNAVQNPSGQGQLFDQELVQVSWSRMAVQSQGLSSDASRLEQLAGTRVHQLQLVNFFTILGLVGVMGAFIVFNFLVVQRRTLKAIGTLREGTEIIGAGNLEFRVAEKENDEVGDLSRAFNRMTHHLRDVTASKSDLEREISERKTAEAKTVYLATFPELNPNPIAELDEGGNVVYINPAARRQFPDLEKTGRKHPFLRDWEYVTGLKNDGKSPVLTRDIKVGDNWFEKTFSYLPQDGHFRVYARDITQRVKAEEELRASRKFLLIANRNHDIQSLLREYTRHIKDTTGCEAVGIRLLDERGKIPYIAYDGFSQKFYETEGPLNITTDKCMCINVVKGDTDPSQPFYTKFGSFYMNGTTRFLATVSEEDKGQTRNVCNKTGYESVALIPIRLGDRILGLVHLADRRENMVPLSVVNMIEDASATLALSVQRATAEKALSDSEARLRRLYDSGVLGVIYWNMGGKITDANDKFLEMVGYTREDLTGDKIDWVKMTPPEFAYLDERSAVELNATGFNGAPFEKEFFRKDGTRMPVLVSGAMLDEAKYNGVAFVIDITDRKKAEAKVKESEEKYRKLFTTMSEGFSLHDIILDTDGKPCDYSFLEINDAFEKLTGLKRENIIGKTVREVIPDIEPYWIELYGKTAITGEPTAFENYSAQLGKWYSTYVYSPEKYRFAVFFSDITERKEAEEEADRRATIVDAVNKVFRDAMTTDTREALGRACLQTLQELTGSKLGFIGETGTDKNLFEIATTEYRGEPWEVADKKGRRRAEAFKMHGMWGGALTSGKSQIWNEPAGNPEAAGTPHKHVPVQAFMSVPLIYDDKPFGIIGLANKAGGYTAEDLEAVEALAPAIVEALMHKKAEEDLRVYSRELEVSNKELEAFSYSVSHDLRTPLRAMDGFSQAIVEDYGDKLDKEGKDYLQRIRVSSQQMSSLIDDLLNLSRINRAELRVEKVDLSQMAVEVTEHLVSTAPERKTTFDIQPNLEAYGDRRFLRLVFENLLGNAFKFTAKRPEGRIEFGQTEINGDKVFFVRDNGAGFDMAYVDKLFKPFQRLHRAEEFGGTGVGLASVQRIVNRVGGRVWAEAEIDKGATFYFTLPLEAGM